MFVYYVVETDKSLDRAAANLEAAVKRNGFGVLYVHDLGTALRSRGVAFGENCKVFEVCNPRHAAEVLSSEMRLNMALPCRVSVYTEKGKTKIGFLKPVQMLAALSQDPALARVAEEVERAITAMVEETK